MCKGSVFCSFFMSVVVFLSLGVAAPAVNAASNSSSPPAIDLDAYGVAEFSDQDGSGAAAYAVVVDRDGIPDNGESHEVWLTLPDGTVIDLPAFQRISPTRYAYWKLVPDETLDPGNYVFRANDLNGGVSQPAFDSYSGDSGLGVPNSSDLQVSENGTTPEFSWSSVANAARYRIQVYEVYDNSTRSRVFKINVDNSTTSYTVPPGILQANTTYYYRLGAWDEHWPLDIDATSKAYSPSFSTGEAGQSPYIGLDSTGVYTWNASGLDAGLYAWIKVLDPQGADSIVSVNMTTPANETLELDKQVIDGNAATYTFESDITPQSGEYVFAAKDADGNTCTRTEYLNADPISPPQIQTSSLQGTSLYVDWSDVDGAAFYRLDIYNDQDERLYKFGTGDSEYLVPPGYLQKDKSYKYTVKVYREFFDQNVDNMATAGGPPSDWPQVTPHSPVRTGDINGDSMLSLADAVLALQAETKQVPAGEALNPAADVDGDGKIGAPEAAYVLRDLKGISGGSYYVHEWGHTDEDDHTLTCLMGMDFAGNGTWEAVNLRDSESGDPGTYSGSYTEQDGIITLDGEKSFYLTPDREKFMNVVAEQSGEDNEMLRFGVANSTLSEVQGTYYVHEWSHDDDTGENYTGLVKVYFDGQGNIQGEVLRDSRGESETFSATYTIANGNIYPSDMNSAFHISPDGQVIASVETENEESLLVGVRESSVESIEGSYYVGEWGKDPDGFDYTCLMRVTFYRNRTYMATSILDSEDEPAVYFGTYSIDSGKVILDGQMEMYVSPDRETLLNVDTRNTPDDNMMLRMGVKLESPAPDLNLETGTWEYTQSSFYNNCPDESATSGSITDTVQVLSADPDSYTVSIDGESVNGTIDGNVLHHTLEYPEDGGVTTESCDINMQSSTYGVGSCTWVWTDGQFSCDGGFRMEIRKQ